MRLFRLYHGQGHTSARVGQLTVLVLWPILRRRNPWLAPWWHFGRAGGTVVVRAGALVVVWMGRRRP